MKFYQITLFSEDGRARKQWLELATTATEAAGYGKIEAARLGFANVRIRAKRVENKEF